MNKPSFDQYYRYDEMKELTLQLEREQFISEQSEEGEKDPTIQHSMVEVI